MNRLLFSLSLFAFTIPLPANAQPTYKSVAPADFKVPEAEVQKWAARIRKLCPEKGWMVSENNIPNLIYVHRVSEPVKNRKVSRFTYYSLRITISPLLSFDKYEVLAEENRRTLDQYQFLEEKIGQLSKSVAVGEQARLEKWQRELYSEELKKLQLYRLPQFYTPEYSLTLYRSWPIVKHFSVKDREAIIEESKRVETAIVNYLGRYTPRNATRPTPPDEYLEELVN